ncbi:hypothetical protein GGR57DRAFT_494917 [Xylariaceae sp. FL1272]|nr:hypothetical protein GGR57DRAFT_494917 [Xylariaceae sp. FL1272]
MDPLTAVGLAAGVVQFVSFASHLVSRTKEIHGSVLGQTDEAATVEATYATLNELNKRLEHSSERDLRLEIVQENTDFAKHVFAINDLSRICAGDCRKLLDMVAKLKASGDGTQRRWQALKIAFKSVYRGNEVAELEQRLQHTQTTLTLHVCSLTSYWHASFDRHLNQLRIDSMELNAKHSKKLNDIVQALDKLSTLIVSARSTTAPDGFVPEDIASIEKQMACLSLSKSDLTKWSTRGWSVRGVVILILRSLAFDSRPVRHSSIAEATRHTFEWALQQAEQRRSSSVESNLLKWLRDGDGLFWVTGKPGSGKSTFIKYVADSPATLSALAQWSYPKRPVIASHYFWSAGTPLQRSRKGLIQTLLYEIFCQLPDLIETRIASLDNIPNKFCFFIDGLDEYGGDHVDFCQSLYKLGQSPHIKICVSSRPWNVFTHSFGRACQDFQLRIHELTDHDIREYAQQRLRDHPRWKQLDGETTKGSWIIDEITDRASGVFLWVFLVTKELRNGLSEYDSFSDLEERLNRIPIDLEAFFKQTLQSVDLFYHQKMATTLQLALAASWPAPIAVYGFLDDEYSDVDYALKLPLHTMAPTQAAAKRDLVAYRLSSRCKGLIDVDRSTLCVEFLHRSVMDFLRTEEMSVFLREKSYPGFNASISLIRAYTAYIKTTHFGQFVDRTGFNQHTQSTLMQAISEVMTQADETPRETEDIYYPLLDELDRCIPEMQRTTKQACLNVWGNPSNPVELFFREAVVGASLAGYLGHILPSDPSYFANFEKPVLSYVLDSLCESCPPASQIPKKIRMVRCLLEHGCDPNAVYYEPTDIAHRRLTPWSDYRTRLQYSERPDIRNLPYLMLRHGADPTLYP